MTIYHQSQKIELSSEAAFNQFADSFTVMEAGGGIVVNNKEEVLMIYRSGTWDLPKGKLDEGETIEECAEREIKEETGIADIQLVNYLTTTFHTYMLKDIPILKKTSWFLFKCDYEQSLFPQLEEGITNIEWVSHAALTEKLTNSYESIREVFTTYFELRKTYEF